MFDASRGYLGRQQPFVDESQEHHKPFLDEIHLEKPRRINKLFQFNNIYTYHLTSSG
jgi:hypothetical protein